MELDLEMIQMFCDEAADLCSRWESVCLNISKQYKTSGCVEFYEELFRLAHNLKGGSRSVGLIAFGDVVHKIEDGITLLRDGKVETDETVLELLFSAEKIFAEWTKHLKEDPLYIYPTDDLLQLYEDIFKPASFEITALSPNETNQEPLSSETSLMAPSVDLSEEFKSNKISPETAGRSQARAQNETVRVSAAKLDELIAAIGELSIHQSIVWHTKGNALNANKMFLNSVQLSQKLTKDLYDRALSLRMQPLNPVFQRLERNILELGRTLKKPVHVEIQGGDVELEKSVIEKIGDPLTHIVRNAIDHGIESAEARREANKPEQGTIRITAAKDAFGIELRISDDGKGLVAKAIHRKAVEKGLIAADRELTQDEMVNLIFLPGFSTAAAVTDLSGRGVGMDVVLRSIADMRGAIRTETVEGQGTTFIITLPTSVSIIDAMVIRLETQQLVVPISTVDEVITLSDGDLTEEQTMMTLRGQILALHDLGDTLGRRESESSRSEKRAVLVCHSGKDRVGLLVDRVLGQQQVVIRPLNENINGVFGILGGTILGNGDPGLILDIPSIVHRCIHNARSGEAAA
jgi:two-component system chemotaxis sensor kinase CheA